MEVRRIEYGSDDYATECLLRERLLRQPLGLSLFDEELSIEAEQWHFGLYEGEELIGCAVAVPETQWKVKLRQMAIVEQRQATGCGRFLLEQVEAALRAKGVQEVHLHARIDAAPFYEKLGYARRGDEFIEVTIPHVEMGKRM